MHVKLALTLLVFTTALVNAEPPSQNYGHGGGGGGYHQPTKIKQSGPSKIFGWLGSRFAKIPYFLPKIPPFPKYQVPHKLPNYQAAIVLPQHPGTEYHGSVETSYGAPESFHGPNETPEKVEITQTDDGQYPAEGPQQDYYPEAAPPHGPAPGPVYDFIPEFKAHSTNDIDVVQSQLISYNKEIIPPNSGWQDGYADQGTAYPDQGTAPAAPFPVSTPPLQNSLPRPASKTVIKHVPVVPHSTGPDYFNTAYGSNKGSSGNQGQGSYQQQSYNQEGFYQSQVYSQEQAQLPGYSAPSQLKSQSNYQQQYQQPQQQYKEPEYQSVKSQQFTYNDAMVPKHQPLPQYNRPQHSYASQGSYAAPAAPQGSYAAPAAPQGSYAAPQPQSSYAAPTASPKPAYQAPHSAANGFVSSGIPGVQILSQQDDGGNPVFEVLADADAPDFNGHPFDINKLIAMIEPGAQLAGAPELSQSASETQNVYTAPPTPTSSSATGTGDLLISESDPHPVLLPSNSSGLKPKSPSKKPIYSFLPKPTPNEASGNKSSSIKDIMDFFQLTGGKGYIVVEKKRSRPNLTDSDSDTDQFLDEDDDDLADGISRVNITSDSLPFLAQQNTDFLEQEQQRATNPSPPPAAVSKLPPRYPTVPKSPMPTTTGKPTTTAPPMVFFAVRATTRHPNHNYNSNLPDPLSSADSGTDGRFNDFLDTVAGSEDDLSFAESNIKSIAITVTPPPRKVVEKEQSSTVPTVVSVLDVKTKEAANSGVKRPAPVYKAGKKS